MLSLYGVLYTAPLPLCQPIKQPDIPAKEWMEDKPKKSITGEFIAKYTIQIKNYILEKNNFCYLCQTGQKMYLAPPQ